MARSERPDPCYSPMLDEALAFAAAAFRHRVRKGSDVPYVTHLLQVMVTVGEHGGDEEQLVAAVLHDYLEDIPGADRDELAERFGARVARLVEAMSDTTVQPKPPWEDRKRRHLASLRGEPAELKLIAAADKLHNARSLLRDHRRVGERTWDRFNATREQTLWYYREVLDALAEGWSHELLDELHEVVRELHEATGVPFERG
ncbi:MAG: HD domain-containing protein [Polyangiales bacterium]